MVAIVGAVERVVAVDVDAVGAAEQAFAPRAQELAVAVEHHHGMLAAVEDIDMVFAVDGDRRHVAELPAVGQLRPVLDHAITMFAASKDYRHCSLLFAGSAPFRGASLLITRPMSA